MIVARKPLLTPAIQPSSFPLDKVQDEKLKAKFQEVETKIQEECKDKKLYHEGLGRIYDFIWDEAIGYNDQIHDKVNYNLVMDLLNKSLDDLEFLGTIGKSHQALFVLNAQTKEVIIAHRAALDDLGSPASNKKNSFVAKLEAARASCADKINKPNNFVGKINEEKNNRKKELPSSSELILAIESIAKKITDLYKQIIEIYPGYNLHLDKMLSKLIPELDSDLTSNLEFHTLYEKALQICFEFLEELEVLNKPNLLNELARKQVFEPCRKSFDEVPPAEKRLLIDLWIQTQNVLNSEKTNDKEKRINAIKKYNLAVKKATKFSDTLKKYASNFMFFAMAALFVLGATIAVASAITPPGFLAWAALGFAAALFCGVGGMGALFTGHEIRDKYKKTNAYKFSLFSAQANKIEEKNSQNLKTTIK